jgi:hypothetical protein
MKEIKAYKTNDGKIFETKLEAEKHENYIKMVKIECEKAEKRKLESLKQYEIDKKEIVKLRKSFISESKNSKELKLKIIKTNQRFSINPILSNCKKLKSYNKKLYLTKNKIRDILGKISTLKNKYRYEHKIFNK